LLLTPKELFVSLGKFDPRYAPAYYEDADYCLQLWQSGYRVVFQPFAAAIHYEFGTSGSEKALAMQAEHRLIFVQKWGEALAQFHPPDPSKVVFAREHKTDARRILFIDDRLPDPSLGSGYPRTYRMLEMLVEMGYKLTFFPMQISAFAPDIAHSLQKLGIEVLYKKTDQEDPRNKINFEEFLKSRPEYYDVVFVSRPHNMEESTHPLKTYARRTSVIYDAEALFSLRDLKFKELNGKPASEAEKDQLINAEVSLVKAANIVTTVSELEKSQFLKYGTSSVHILGHIIEPHPTPAPFEERKDILFIGSILFDPSPNGDAVRYFASQIFPLIRQSVDCDFYIVGTNRVKAIWNLESEHVHVVGKVEELLPYYNRSRLFVVPTRYSAGIPLKLLEATAHGLPAVVTPLTATQLGWRENHDFLVGRDPEDFAKKVIDLYTHKELFETIRQNALERLQQDYSPDQFRTTLQHVLASTIRTYPKKSRITGNKSETAF
jgi:glycosyltransferase involved in cell wall biosynthesis